MWQITGVVAVVLSVSLLVAAPPASAGSFHVEYRFKGGANGMEPTASLTKVGDKLYGTTAYGGASGVGTIFTFDPSTGIEMIVYAFRGGTDGSTPYTPLIKVDGKLYGTTSYGGLITGNCSLGCGTVFSFDPSTGAESVVRVFKGDGDGQRPSALVNVSSIIYGTTAGDFSGSCASNRCGTIFSIDTATNVETVLYAFTGNTLGWAPDGGLVEIGGLLYGTTSAGGSGNCRLGCGTVYKFDLKSDVETVMYEFKGGTDGVLPFSSVIETGGALYGTTEEGGGGPYPGGSGTVYSVNLASGAEMVLHVFNGGDDGAIPFGGVIEVGDTLYGTTFRGGGGSNDTCGSDGCGTVFSLDSTTGAEKVLHAFKGVHAAFPVNGLTYFSHRLFGTTVYGGNTKNCSNGCGAVFSLKP